MDIIISQRLRELRRKKGNTQEDDLHGEFTYTSTILAGLSENADNYVTNAKLSDRETYRRYLTEEDSGMFDSWRETDWFRDVIGRLSK